MLQLLQLLVLDLGVVLSGGAKSVLQPSLLWIAIQQLRKKPALDAAKKHAQREPTTCSFCGDLAVHYFYLLLHASQSFAGQWPEANLAEHNMSDLKMYLQICSRPQYICSQDQVLTIHHRIKGVNSTSYESWPIDKTSAPVDGCNRFGARISASQGRPGKWQVLWLFESVDWKVSSHWVF